MPAQAGTEPHGSFTTSTSSGMVIISRMPFHSFMVGVSRRGVKRNHRPVKTRAVMVRVGIKVQVVQHDKVIQCSRKGVEGSRGAARGLRGAGRWGIMEWRTV